MYKALKSDRIADTLERLARRVAERFPGSGLSHVAIEVAEIGRAAGAHAARLRRPFYWLRVGVALAILAGIAAQIFSIKTVRLEFAATDALGLFQGLDAAVNLLILAAGAVWFLLTLEARVKRDRTLKRLHELRSLAHIVDMHQLTKDPTVILAAHHHPTPSSPVRAMSQFELTRYLDYCSEMLALLGKLAAIYAESSQDPVVIEAVNDLETLTTNLGRKIWQKITIIQALDEDEPPVRASA